MIREITKQVMLNYKVQSIFQGKFCWEYCAVMLGYDVEICFPHIYFPDPPTPPMSPFPFIFDNDDNENYSFNGHMCGENPCICLVRHDYYD
jgi:hypothetical protein